LNHNARSKWANVLRGFSLRVIVILRAVGVPAKVQSTEGAPHKCRQ
jgi:hypothetical protein